MKFWFTEKIGYLILLLTLILPFNIMYQFVSDDQYTIVMMAALWQYIFRAPDYIYFAFSPFGVIYIIWYGPGVYIAKLAYDATKTDKWMRYDYAVRIVMVIILQILIDLIIPPSSGYPPPVNIPLPIPGIVALLLARWTVKAPTKVWETQQKEEELFSD